MGECLFCKIIDGSIPSVKVWENENYLAILDVNPNTEGMSLVLPKKHFDSYLFDMSDEQMVEFVKATKVVAKLLEKGLEVQRVAMVMEGMGINHAHIKLYPLYGISEKFQEMWSKDKIYFDHYEGYISTQLGPPKELAELEKTAIRIKKAKL